MRNLVRQLGDRLAAANPKRAFARARDLQKSGAHHRASKLFAAAADAGMGQAAQALALCYLQGQGVPRDLAEAGSWFKRAAEQGLVESQVHLARLHLFGLRASALEASPDLFAPRAAQEADYHAALFWARKAAEAGSAEAQAILGYIHTAGPADLCDEAAAHRWYNKSAAASCAPGQLGFGLALMRKAETGEATVEAIDLIKLAAAQGLPSAHYYLGVVYERAIGLHADLEKAAHHYGIAAAGGVRNAQAKYGWFLHEGRGVAADTINGESWLRCAALAGDAQAAALLGDIYARGGRAAGQALPPNYTEAAMWFTRAAEAGHATAARALGLLYLTGAGISRDPDAAAKWLARAGQAGDKTAQADLASLLLSGATDEKLTPPPPVHEWFEQAAEAGDLIGAYNYGVCLARGVGVEKDEARAAFWLKRAAEGVVNAQYWYGRMLLDGRGVPEDAGQARHWLSRAAEAGMTEALVVLAEMRVNGRGGPVDHAGAKTLFEQAAKHGHSGAMFALGALHGGGHDVPMDRAVAITWFRAAAALDHPVASLMLGRYLRKGLAGPADVEEARKWLEKALALGVAEAAEDLLALTRQAAEPGAARLAAHH